MNQTNLKYLLIIPARNEADYIGLTLQSVVAQTVRPERVVVVSDGSTDGTDEIVSKFADKHDYIELYRMPERETRDFGGKAYNVNHAYDRLKDLEHDLVVSLDADITFEPDYFEFVISKFEAHPKLGIGGTPFSEDGKVYNYRFASTEHVSGACQVFRRECFVQMKGYTQVKGGGLDVIACLTARYNGWETQTFTEKASVHHRPMGSANFKNPFLNNMQLGERQYCLGFHPLWQLMRATYQMTKRPFLLAGLGLGAGYFWAMLRRVQRPIGVELVKYQRKDQMRRLKGFLRIGRRALVA